MCNFCMYVCVIHVQDNSLQYGTNIQCAFMFCAPPCFFEYFFFGIRVTLVTLTRVAMEPSVYSIPYLLLPMSGRLH